MEKSCKDQGVAGGASRLPHHRASQEAPTEQQSLTSTGVREDEMTALFARELGRGTAVPHDATIHDLRTLLSPGQSGISPCNWTQVLLRAGLSRQQPVGYFRLFDGSIGKVRCSFLERQQGVSLVMWADSIECVKQLKRVSFSTVSANIGPAVDAETFGFAYRFGRTTTVVALGIPEKKEARSAAEYRRLTRQVLSIVVHELAEAEEGATEYGSRLKQDQYLGRQAEVLKDLTIGPVWGTPMARLRSVRTTYSEAQYYGALTEALQLHGPLLGVPSPKAFDGLVLSRNALATWQIGEGRLEQDLGLTTYGLPVLPSGDARASTVHVVKGDYSLINAHAVGEPLRDRALDARYGAAFREFVSRAIGYHILRKVRDEAQKEGGHAVTTQVVRAKGAALAQSMTSGNVHRILQERIEAPTPPPFFTGEAHAAILELFGGYPSLRSAEERVVFLTEDYCKGAALSISLTDRTSIPNELEKRLAEFVANRARVEALVAARRETTWDECPVEELGRGVQFLPPAQF